ncbi:GNAT family N-acetyltransferase [Tengunoibacter tsumagoiensis]|uniref:N-acetyltransferase n=1 Tax=Tengunoibacter tsumagoiensis TaxID=2014871 RepID=A0A402A3I6_9CHLR|nr:GNAT family N-acetyltransferase [Tengunoibacter tsumagoiensis]GCE13609.1 N-acetyltransferase [Tengunoibacter tsumagoiensis]
MHLQTRRLIVREFTMADLSAIYHYESQPEFARYLSYGPWTLEECHEDLAFHVTHQHEPGRIFYHLAIVLSERLIGWCGLKIMQQDAREAELGYGIHPSFWQHGYATEAAQAMIAEGFTTLNMHRIFATCDPRNQGSEHVLQKLGMQKEGHFREHKWNKGAWKDSLYYSILEQEWRLRIETL